MIRARTAAALLTVLLAATACTGNSEPDGDNAPTDDAPASASTTPTAPDPVTFYSRGRACTEFTGPIVIWEEMEVDAPLTLDAFTPAGLVGDFKPRAASVVAVDEDEVPFTGSVRGVQIPDKWVDDVGWRDREPVDGATVEPGHYYVFLQGRVTGPASYDGIELSWTDESGAAGSTLWESRDHYRKHCGS